MKRFIKIFIIIIMIFSSFSAYAEKLKVFFIDFNTIGVPEHYGKVIQTYVEDALVNNYDFHMIEREKVDVILREIKMKNERCQEPACIIHAGGLLVADIGITGTVEKKKDKIEVNFKLITIDNAKIIKTISVSMDNLNDIKRFTQTADVKLTKELKRYEKTGSPNNRNYEIYISGGIEFNFPVSVFARIAEAGVGYFLNIGVKDIGFDGFMLGGQAGNNIFFPKSGDDFGIGYHFPIFLSLGYTTPRAWILSLSFFIMPGINISHYVYDYVYSFWPKEHRSIGVSPIGKTAIYLNLGVNTYVDIQIGGTMSFLFEKENVMMYSGIYVSGTASF